MYMLATKLINKPFPSYLKGAKSRGISVFWNQSSTEIKNKQLFTQNIPRTPRRRFQAIFLKGE